MNLAQQQEYYDDKVVPIRRKKKVIKQKTDSFENLTIKEITPLNYNQKQFFESFYSGLNILAAGSAGTGKSYVAMYLALEKLFRGDVSKIVILRSAVSTRDIGFLPGSILEKMEPYFSLYKDHVNQICGNGTAWDILFKKGYIDFESTSFMRGKTWNDAVLFFDEAQNCTRHEIYSALTRVGKNTQVVICGDQKQTDLMKKDASWDYLTKLIQAVSDVFDVVRFTEHDIVRSDFVKKIIIADGEIL